MIVRNLLVGSVLGVAAAIASADEALTLPTSTAQASGVVEAWPAARTTGCRKAGPESRQDRDCLKLLNQTAWTYDADDLTRDVRAIERQRKAAGDPGQRGATFGDAADRDTPSVGMAKAARPDCRTAYQGFLLLAIPFLLKDTITGTGCKW